MGRPLLVLSRRSADAVKAVGFGLKEGFTLLHSGADQGAVVPSVRNRGPVVFIKNLIEPDLVIERAESGFETLDRIITSGVVEAFVVDPADPEPRCRGGPRVLVNRIIR